MTHQTPDPALAAEQMPAVPSRVLERFDELWAGLDKDAQLAVAQIAQERLSATHWTPAELAAANARAAKYSSWFLGEQMPAVPERWQQTQAELDAVTREMDVIYARWPKLKKESDDHRAIREKLLAPLRERCREIGMRRYALASDARQPEQPDSVHVTSAVPAGAPTTLLPVQRVTRVIAEPAVGQTFVAMRANVSTELCQLGDARLMWVNEGSYYGNQFEAEIAARAAAPDSRGLSGPAQQNEHEPASASTSAQQVEQSTTLEPVAWTLTETLKRRETTTRGYLWFTDPQNCMWSPLYATPEAAMAPVREAREALRVAYEELASLNKGIGWRDGEWHSVAVTREAIARIDALEDKKEQSNG